ncbi:hypothetical protein DFP73DRAFT_528155 [Morchella snyderi]|nr:hypothetical protein DFP73DRAFT_528155 [Morchella snyderi]
MKYTEVIILCFAASILTIIALLGLVCISALPKTIFPSLRQVNATMIPTSTDANADSALGYSQLPPRYSAILWVEYCRWTQLPHHYSNRGACSPIVAPGSGPVSSRPGVCISRNTHVPAYPRLPGLPLPAKSVPTRPCANLDRGAQHAALATPFLAVAAIVILNPPRLERKDLAAVAAVLCGNVGGGRIDTLRKHMNNPAAGPMDEELMDEELMDVDPMDVDLINAIDFTQVQNDIITRPKNEDKWFEEQLECTQDTHVDEEYMLGLNEEKMYRRPNPTQPQLVSTLSNNGAVSGVGMVPEYLARDIDEVEELIGEPMDEDILERDPAGGRATNVELQTQNLAYGIEAVQPIQAAKPLGRWDRNIGREKWKRKDISRVKAQWVKAPKELAKLQEKNPHIFLVRWTLPRSGGGFDTAETPLAEPTKQQGKYQPQVEMAPSPPKAGYEMDETVEYSLEELAKQQKEVYQYIPNAYKRLPEENLHIPQPGGCNLPRSNNEPVESLARQQEENQLQMEAWAPKDGYETDETVEYSLEELAKQQKEVYQYIPNAYKRLPEENLHIPQPGCILTTKAEGI